jgi:hypothetical protein
MENTVGNVVVANQAEDLGLVDVTGVCPRVKDAVGIHGVGLTVTLPGLIFSSLGMNAEAGGRRKATLLIEVEGVLDGKKEGV